MRPRKQFRILIVVLLVAAFSLSCKLVNRFDELRAAATDLSSVRTEVDLGGLSTQMGEIATNIDMNAVSTEVAAAMTEMPGILTEMPGAITQLPGMLTEMPGMLTDMPRIDIPGLGMMGTPQPTPQGFPPDIPVMTDTNILFMDGGQNRLEYTNDAEINTVAQFYRQQMAAQGWSELPGASLSDEQADLSFQKGGRIARLHIETELIFGVTITITVEGS